MAKYSDSTDRNGRQIQSIISQGADALPHLFDLAIKFPSEVTTKSDFVTSGEDSVIVRLKTTPTLPDGSIETYDVVYKGVKMSFPKGDLNMDRSVDCEFRMDAQYGLYEDFQSWLRFVANIQTGGISNWPAALGELKLIALQNEYLSADLDQNGNTFTDLFSQKDVNKVSATAVGNNNIVWHMKDVWVQKVTAPKFTVEAGDPQSFTVTFKYGDIEFPFLS